MKGTVRHENRESFVLHVFFRFLNQIQHMKLLKLIKKQEKKETTQLPDH